MVSRQGDEGGIWKSRGGHRGYLGNWGLKTIVRRQMRRAGFKPPKMGPHTLRHTFGTQYIIYPMEAMCSHSGESWDTAESRPRCCTMRCPTGWSRSSIESFAYDTTQIRVTSAREATTFHRRGHRLKNLCVITSCYNYMGPECYAKRIELVSLAYCEPAPSDGLTSVHTAPKITASQVTLVKRSIDTPQLLHAIHKNKNKQARYHLCEHYRASILLQSSSKY